MKIMFSVPGDPKGKGRPKFSTVNGHVNARTPDQTVVYENQIRMEYTRANGSKRFDAGVMLDMRVLAFYAIPESASKKKKAAMENREIRPTKKPDFDNVAKIVADSLNRIAYHDDAQIVDAQVRKFYSREPKIVVTICEVKGGSTR